MHMHGTSHHHLTYGGVKHFGMGVALPMINDPWPIGETIDQTKIIISGS